MRAILVDWLVEVQESFELNHETLYTAVKILDLYMANKVVNKEELQLVGATACLIACKIDERFVYNYIHKSTECSIWIVHWHSLEIRGLCLMKLSSKTLQKFAIFLEYENPI